MWARIDNGIVAEIIDFDPSGKFHAAIEWVKCSGDTEIGMTYKSNNFGPKPAPDATWLIAQGRAERDRQLRDVYDVGIIRAQRDERLGSDVSERVAALDAYAVALLDVPQQPGFPTTINWPDIPDA